MSGAGSPERPYGDLITTTLRVMTWNVSGRFGPWQEREAALIRTLETLAPDVVTLQECWRDRSGQDQAAHLARALGYHSAYGGGTFLAEDWATGSALLSRWPIEHHEHREFPASAPERLGGSALFGRIAGSGSWGGQRPSRAPYVTRVGPMDGATAAGGRLGCLSSKDPTLTETRSLRNRTPWNI